MDKQIVFYSKRYKIGYSSKDKCLYSPQIIKNENNIEFIKKLVYYILVFPFYLALSGISIVISVYSETYFLRKFAIPITMISFVVSSVLFVSKKRKPIDGTPVYTNTTENRKMLREVIMHNNAKYWGVIALKISIFCMTIPFFRILVSYESFEGMVVNVSLFLLPIYLVMIIDRNIYYQIIIRKIAKQYGISLKSKDVLEENDAEAEKQINAENKANEENGTNTKNISTTENEINTEDYTITPKDTSTQSNSIQNLDKPADKQ